MSPNPPVPRLLSLFTVGSTLFWVALSLNVAHARQTASPTHFRANPSAIQLPWAVTDGLDPKQIPCYQTIPVSSEDLEKRILSEKMGKKVRARIGSLVDIEDDSRLIEALFWLVSRPDGSQVSLVDLLTSRFSQAELRQTYEVIPLTQKLFGEKEGLQLLYLLLHYGYNGSHLQFGSTPWKAEELDSVLLALEDLPPHLVPFPLNEYSRLLGTPYNPFIRSSVSASEQKPENPIIIADSHIRIYDLWTKKDLLGRKDTILHEIGHNLQFLIRRPHRNDWSNLSPWPNRNQEKDPDSKGYSDEIRYVGNHVEPFVSGYAKSSPIEDFAESVVAYRYRADWLLERNPEKYDYLKRVIFNGIEYRSAETCKQEGRFLPGINQALRDKMVRFQIDQVEGNFENPQDATLSDRLKKCDLTFIKSIGNDRWSARNEHERCTAEAYQNWVSIESLASIPNALELQDIAKATKKLEPVRFNIYVSRNLSEIGLRQILKDYYLHLESFFKLHPSKLFACDELNAFIHNSVIEKSESGSWGQHFGEASRYLGQHAQSVCRERFLAMNPLERTYLQIAGTRNPSNFKRDYQRGLEILFGF